MKHVSVRLSEATIEKIKKLKEQTGLQTYNDVVFFILSQHEKERYSIQEEQDKRKEDKLKQG
jgi:hypothetical protein